MDTTEEQADQVDPINLIPASTPTPENQGTNLSDASEVAALPAAAATMPERARCGDSGGRTRTGAPCLAILNLNPANGRCVHHDEQRAAQRAAIRAAIGSTTWVARRQKAQEAREKAAAATPQQPILETFDGLIRMEAATLHQLYTGKMDAKTADSITRAIDVQRRNLHDRDTLKELIRLRAEIRQAKRERAGQHGTNGRFHR